MELPSGSPSRWPSGAAQYRLSGGWINGTVLIKGNLGTVSNNLGRTVKVGEFFLVLFRTEFLGMPESLFIRLLQRNVIAYY